MQVLRQLHWTSAVLLVLAPTLFAADTGGKGNPISFDPARSVRMRDGVVLRADIYRPAQDGKYPILLTRTPYDKSQVAAFAIRAAQNGYVVIVQDVRGRYSSQGEWYPFLHEAQDGYDTIEWTATLPYANGQIGMFGESYVGATQVLAAITHPPHLSAICPIDTASDYHDGWVYQGGAFEQWFNQTWTSILAQDTLRRAAHAVSDASGQRDKLPLRAYTLFRFPEMTNPPDLIKRLAPYYADWLAHPDYDDYWKRISIEEHYADIRVPALTVGAWYDIFQGGTLRNYAGIRSRSSADTARRNQHLLMAIGGHAGSGRKIGDIDFGPAAEEYTDDGVTLDWYDYLFKGVQNKFAGPNHVHYFLMGPNEWRHSPDWPPPDAQSIRLFLHSRGGANTLHGNGGLSNETPKQEEPDRYVYDPQDPVPTHGSSLCCDNKVANGPQDQRRTEERPDVLIYSTPQLPNDLTVTGPVTVELYAMSSAKDTDFTAKLVDVSPDGYARNVTEGIIRARSRNSRVSPSLLTPGVVYKYKIDLWSTANVFARGHILRLEVSSSNSPRFDRNLNTGEPIASGVEAVKATNSVLHDPAHPSALVLWKNVNR